MLSQAQEDSPMSVVQALDRVLVRLFKIFQCVAENISLPHSWFINLNSSIL